ncbi:MAG TPA: hypothetical protein VMM84_06565 [Pyrinomonadaceae bacterium]|nr:hypothetical protein [Pyrinomonadaceae bacterium]
MPAVKFRQLAKLTLLIVVLSACEYSVSAQRIRPPSPTEILDAQRSGPSSDEDQRLGSIEDEMRAKRAIKYAEQNYKKNLARAQEVAELAKNVNLSFKENRALNRDDLKKIEKMQKLAKQIRSNAGGSGDGAKIEERPRDLTEALDRVAEMSDSLRERVEKTPRQVVSASVIDEANVLLELINIVRGMSR